MDLKKDEENEKEREENRDAVKPYNDIEDEENSPFENLQITDDGSTLIIEFENAISEGWLEILVSDTGGIPYITVPRRRIEAGHNTVNVDLGRLPEGEYAVFITNGDTRLSQTFTHR